MQERTVGDIVAGQRLMSADATYTVVQATRLMTRCKVGALLVMDGPRLEGIFSERDVVNRVVAEGLDPKSTTVSDVMSGSVVTVSPETTASEALAMMQQGGFRHLPVVQDGKPIGMVSLRDLMGQEAPAPAG